MIIIFFSYPPTNFYIVPDEWENDDDPGYRRIPAIPGVDDIFECIDSDEDDYPDQQRLEDEDYYDSDEDEEYQMTLVDPQEADRLRMLYVRNSSDLRQSGGEQEDDDDEGDEVDDDADDEGEDMEKIEQMSQPSHPTYSTTNNPGSGSEILEAHDNVLALDKSDKITGSETDNVDEEEEGINPSSQCHQSTEMEEKDPSTFTPLGTRKQQDRPSDEDGHDEFVKDVSNSSFGSQAESAQMDTATEHSLRSTATQSSGSSAAGEHPFRDLQTFYLPVIVERNRTGFEESRDFRIVIGDVIANRYKIVRYLGSAAFSSAVHCVDLESGEEVCVKIIKVRQQLWRHCL